MRFQILTLLVLLLQSRWTKNQLAEVLQSMATQAGIKLSIGQIEGKIPLKWNFSQVELVLPEGETISVNNKNGNNIVNMCIYLLSDRQMNLKHVALMS